MNCNHSKNFKSKSFISFSGAVLLIFTMMSCGGNRKLAGVQKPMNTEEWVHYLFDTSGVHSGLYMIEAGVNGESKKPIIDYFSNSLFTPASNTKLLTLYASLKFLPDRLTSLKYMDHDGITYFKGTGDPGFLDPRFESEDVVPFLKDQNKLVYVGDWTSDNRWGTGWSWDDYPFYYSAQRSPFPIYGNMVRAWCQDGNWHLFPGNFIQNRVTWPFGLSIKRQESQNIFQINSLKCRADTLRIPFVWNTEVFTNLLKDTIHKPMDWIQSLPVGVSDNWSSLPGSVRDTLLRAMMYESDNFIAEQMLWNISASQWDTISTERVIDSLMATDFESWQDKIRWVDGSGLSVYNKFTPRFLVELLGKLYDSMAQDQLLRYFAAGGERGTVASWYSNNGDPYVYAKTGTLSAVHCLSGYLLADSGKTYIFSFMHNNFLGSSSQYKTKMEILLRWVKEHY